MRIISKKAIIDFYKDYPDAKVALEDWCKTTTKATWTCFADGGQSVNHAVNVGYKRYVSNIKGNDYRLVVTIKVVFIRFLVHANGMIR